MDTINQILPFYDKLTKQDHQRYLTGSPALRKSPLTTFLPFLIKRPHSATNQSISTAYMVDALGVQTDVLKYFVTGSNLITSWTNGPTNTYDDGWSSIGADFGAAQTHAVASRATSNSFSVTSGKSYSFSIVMGVVVGELPTIRIVDSSNTTKSNVVTLTSGSTNNITLTATGTGTYYIQVQNTTITSFTLTVNVSKLNGITFYAYTLVDYFQFTDSAFWDSQTLTPGYYYLKIYDGITTYYSEWFSVVDTSSMIKLSFSNSVDVGDILYAHSFSQTIYFDAVLLQDEPKMTVTGDIKDGVLITEKVVMAPVYTFVDWVSPSLLKVLYMVNGHTTISLTDDQGTVYTPNNFEIIQQHDIYDLFNIIVKFTSGEMVNTLNNNAIS